MASETTEPRRQLLLPYLLPAMLLARGVSAGATKPQSGEVVLRTGFDTEEERRDWSHNAFARWENGYAGTTSLSVSIPADSREKQAMIRLSMDLTRYRGCRLLFTCQVKARDVTKPADLWNGVKFMLHYTSPATGPYWQNRNGVYGTFDWKELSFLARIAPDAEGGELDLGLQDSTGTVWFDEIEVSVFRGPPPTRPKPPAHPGPVFTGHKVPRLRGVMSPQKFRDEDLRVLGLEWKANVIRWQITRNWGRAGTDRDLAEYDDWFNAKLGELDEALAACRRYGLKVVVDMHTPPGGRYENKELAIFHEPRYQDHYVALWKRIARRYKGNTTIWGYDLVNEPVQNTPSPPGVPDYLGTQVRAAKAIRALDPKIPIFIEAGEWDSPGGYRDLVPVDISRVIYQVHMYVPGEFTHQGVFNKKTGIRYPGVIGGKPWNKDRLRKVLQPVREFQLAYNVHIYVGEFSAIRWAPGAAQYLSDCIDLFEEFGWDWTYHAYREWDGWSVEHSSNRADHVPTKEPTDRKKLLLKWFARNQQPHFGD